MKTKQTQPVVPWHTKTAEDIADIKGAVIFVDGHGGSDWETERLPEAQIAAIIAANDPHAETVRLLEEAYLHVYNAAFEERRAIALVDSEKKSPITELAERIRANLAKLKGTQ